MMEFVGNVARNFRHDIQKNPVSTTGMTLLIPSISFYLMTGDERAGYAALISSIIAVAGYLIRK